MQKIFNNKVIAILGLISSIYVIAFLVLLLFSTMTLLNVATLFYIMMWVAIAANLIVIAGFLYRRFGENRNWTRQGVTLLAAQIVSVVMLIFKGIELISALARLATLYSGFGQYRTTAMNGGIGSLMFRDIGATLFVIVLVAANVVILMLSIMLLGNGIAVDEPSVENNPSSVAGTAKAEDTAEKTADTVKEDSEVVK